ncbi:MAG: hypothetical protein GXP06_07855 [Alphaproteobacteria bacterium]|nr:hypothetical protein [Alphaproteobacteria bacterium]
MAFDDFGRFNDNQFSVRPALLEHDPVRITVTEKVNNQYANLPPHMHASLLEGLLRIAEKPLNDLIHKRLHIECAQFGLDFYIVTQLGLAEVVFWCRSAENIIELSNITYSFDDDPGGFPAGSPPGLFISWKTSQCGTNLPGLISAESANTLNHLSLGVVIEALSQIQRDSGSNYRYNADSMLAENFVLISDEKGGVILTVAMR